MLTSKQLNKYKMRTNFNLESLRDFMIKAQQNGLNYIFVNKDSIDNQILDILKSCDYSILIGQGEQARIKISW